MENDNQTQIVETNNNEVSNWKKFQEGLVAFPKNITAIMISILQAIGNILTMISCWVSSMNLAIARKLEPGTYGTRAALGAFMCIVVTVAAASMAYTASLFTDDKALIVLAGIVYALLILLLDRAFINADDDKKKKAFNDGIKLSMWDKLKAIPWRMLVIGITAFMISTSAGLGIFESEVDGLISEKRIAEENSIFAETDSLTAIIEKDRFTANQEVSKKAADHSQYVQGLDQELSTLRQKLQDLQQELIDETQGEVGSGKKGNGPAAKRIAEVIQTKSEELTAKQKRRDSLVNTSVSFNELKATEETTQKRNLELDEELQKIKDNERRRLGLVEINVSDGFLARYTALQELKQQPYMGLLINFVFGFFFILEILPLLFKTFFMKDSKSPYIRELAAQDKRHDIELQDELQIKLIDERVGHSDHIQKQQEVLFKNEMTIANQKSTHEKSLADVNFERVKHLNEVETELLEKKSELRKTMVEDLDKEVNSLSTFKTSLDKLIENMKSTKGFSIENQEIDNMKKVYIEKFQNIFK